MNLGDVRQSVGEQIRGYCDSLNHLLRYAKRQPMQIAVTSSIEKKQEIQPEFEVTDD